MNKCENQEPEIREEDGTLVITGNAPAGMGNYPEWYYEDMEE